MKLLASIACSASSISPTVLILQSEHVPSKVALISSVCVSVLQWGREGRRKKKTLHLEHSFVICGLF